MRDACYRTQYHWCSHNMLSILVSPHVILIHENTKLAYRFHVFVYGVHWCFFASCCLRTKAVQTQPVVWKKWTFFLCLYRVRNTRMLRRANTISKSNQTFHGIGYRLEASFSVLSFFTGRNIILIRAITFRPQTFIFSIKKRIFGRPVWRTPKVTCGKLKILMLFLV